jgi:diaminopimelate epimerase
MHGAGNDFVVIDHRRPFLPPDRSDLVARLCDRRHGIGADGVLLLEEGAGVDFVMSYYNADGGPADFCGNGARCLASRALDLGLGRDGAVRFRTACGILRAQRVTEGMRVEVGRVEPPGAREEVEAAGRRFAGRRVVAGVPHFVVFVDGLEGVPVGEWGRALRRHPRFAPEGTNVDFAARLGAGRIALRTFERGVEGETLACGSGAIACALAAGVEGVGPPLHVRTAGGDELVVDWTLEGDAYCASLTGPVAVSFAGIWGEVS